MSTGSWIFSILATIIILGLIVGLIVWAVSPRGDRGGSAPTTGESAREILDRRLASGELTVEQYEQLREALGGAASNSSDDLRPRDPAGAPG
ncbi:MAG: SHOCT domain-containing protein [Solirubrobacteraceae bacterium]